MPSSSTSFTLKVCSNDLWQVVWCFTISTHTYCTGAPEQITINTANDYLGENITCSDIDTCIFLCNVSFSCNSATIVCPIDYDCIVTCVEDNACTSTTIIGQDGKQLNVSLDFQNNFMTIFAPRDGGLRVTMTNNSGLLSGQPDNFHTGKIISYNSSTVIKCIFENSCQALTIDETVPRDSSKLADSGGTLFIECEGKSACSAAMLNYTVGSEIIARLLDTADIDTFAGSGMGIGCPTVHDGVCFVYCDGEDVCSSQNYYSVYGFEDMDLQCVSDGDCTGVG